MLYIFIANNIGGIGGQQIYLDSKVRHLGQRGWRVVVLNSYSMPPSIESLKPFWPRYSVAGLRHRYSTLTRRRRERILGEIERLVEPDGRVVVESYTYETAIWGEALARHLSRRCDAAHFCYLLTEYPPMPLPEEAAMLMFKWRQGLLRAIDPGYLHRILPGISDGDGFLFPEYSRDGCIADRPLPSSARSQRGHDMKILTVGRLEKPYVYPMLKDIKRFASRMWSRGESVSLVIAGDVCGPGGKRLRRRLRRLLADAPGLDTQWWGMQWPMPRRAYREADVFIGVSGAVEEAAREGLPAIAVDSSDCRAIGIYGEQTSNSFSRSDTEPPVDTADLLMELRLQRDLRREARHDTVPLERPLDFHIHDLLADCACQQDYFPVETIPPRSGRARIVRLLNRLGLFPAINLVRRCM